MHWLKFAEAEEKVHDLIFQHDQVKFVCPVTHATSHNKNNSDSGATFSFQHYETQKSRLQFVGVTFAFSQDK